MDQQVLVGGCGKRQAGGVLKLHTLFAPVLAAAGSPSRPTALQACLHWWMGETGETSLLLYSATTTRALTGETRQTLGANASDGQRPGSVSYPCARASIAARMSIELLKDQAVDTSMHRCRHRPSHPAQPLSWSGMDSLMQVSLTCSRQSIRAAGVRLGGCERAPPLESGHMRPINQ